MGLRHNFKTFADAINAGYEYVDRHTDHDISGPDSYGYEYERADGTKSVVVWLTEERNKMGQYGAFLAMFPPKEAK
jgi:hypothetical protein